MSAEAVDKPEFALEWTRRQRKKPSGPVQALMGRYVGAYRARWGREPLIFGGKDHGILARVIRAVGPEEAARMLDLFMASNDAHAARRGWTIGAFEAMLPSLRLGTDGMDHRLTDNIDAARRAMRRGGGGQDGV